jgi:hypothetical protein
MGICAHLCRCIKASAAHDAVSSRKASATASRAGGERGSNPKNGPAQPESAAAYLADVGCSHRRRMDAARASRSTHRHRDSPSRVGGRPAGTAPDGVAIPGPGTSGRQRRAPLYQMPRTSARASQKQWLSSDPVEKSLVAGRPEPWPVPRRARRWYQRSTALSLHRAPDRWPAARADPARRSAPDRDAPQLRP